MQVPHKSLKISPSKALTIFLLLLGIVLCMAFYFVEFPQEKRKQQGKDKVGMLRGTVYDPAASTSSNMTDIRNFPPKTHLVVVAGHAVLDIHKLGFDRNSEAAWKLLTYQQHQGFPEIIKSHIQKGIDIASADKESVLIFSGGQTRLHAGQISEAASYYLFMTSSSLLDSLSDASVALEEFARDSFENLLFSIARFKEVTGSYPKNISVVGFDFKEQRFVNVIRKAIRFPLERFKYAGVKPDTNRFNYEKAVSGEKEVYSQLEMDMYGCHTPALQMKKLERNPFHRTIPYALSCPEIKELLEWCQPHVYGGILPW